MKAGQIQLYLAQTNGWWRDTSWQKNDPDLRKARVSNFIYRANTLANLTVGGLYVLRGPRRVGKSTEIKYVIGDLLAGGTPPRNIIHAAVDGWRAEDLRALISTASKTFLAGVSGPRYWFLDEITSVQGDWPNVIKNLRDTDAAFAADTVVLTGSSAAGLHEIRKALAGRRGPATNSDRVMLPMRFTDFVAATGVILPDFPLVRVGDLREFPSREGIDILLPFLGDLVPLWEGYLRIGGFPQAVAEWKQTGDAGEALTTALWDTIYGDAINAARLTSAQVATLLARLAINLCSPLNVRDLARDLDLTPTTADQRLADLTEHFIVWPCHREQGLLPKVSTQRKVYFTDPLLARLAALRSFGREPDLTQLNEQQIGLALLRHLTANNRTKFSDFDTVLYYRSKTNSEIDFVSRQFGEIAVESKYVDGGWGREMQTISASPWFGVLASRTGVDWLQDGWVIPAPILVLLLGS